MLNSNVLDSKLRDSKLRDAKALHSKLIDSTLRWLSSSPVGRLVVVAVCYGIAQVVFASLSAGLGWDESVYVSQVSPHAPAAYFSAPRSRGITLLPAPLVAVTSWVPALRLYMTALSVAGLVAAFWPWAALLGNRVVALAALLLTGLWVVQYYGNQVMPNLYVAFGALAATGWLLRAIRGTGSGRRGALLAMAGGLAFVSLMRPPDAAFLTAALLAIAVIGRGGRRADVLVAQAAGPAVGAIPWLIEAYARYGGVMQRLELASRREGGMGWHPEAVLMHLHALNGPTLCRPCTVGWQDPYRTLWWPALPLLVAAGLLLAHRTHRLALAAVPAAAGAALAIPYLLLTPYAAPRFLTATYALLAIPVALLIDGVVTASRPRWRPWAIGTATAVLLAQFISQNSVLRQQVAGQTTNRKQLHGLAVRLRNLGIRPPCAIAGDEAPWVAYYARCASAATAGDNPAVTRRTILSVAAHTPAFAAIGHDRRRGDLGGWQRYRYAPHRSGEGWCIYLPPPPEATRPPRTAGDNGRLRTAGAGSARKC